MRVFVVFFALCVMSGCKPVDFKKKNPLSILDRARAVETLRMNAAAFSAGDIDAMEATMHPDVAGLTDAQALFDRYAPKMEISAVKFVSQSAGGVVFEYTQAIQSTRQKLPVTSARVRTLLLRTDNGWGIRSTDILSLSR